MCITLAAAVGLAPAAFGLVTGPVAHAAEAVVPSPQHKVKTVSLHHVQRLAAGGAVAASSSSVSSVGVPGVPAFSPGVSPARHCTGSIGASATHNNLHEQFWYSPAGCIGTVEGTMQYKAHVYKCIWSRIYHSGALKADLLRACATGSASDTLHATWHVWTSYSTPVKVCVKSTYDTVGACKTVDQISTSTQAPRLVESGA